MTTIEQTVEPTNGAIDLHVDVPAEWEGYVLKGTIERTEAKAETPKETGLSQHKGAFAHFDVGTATGNAEGVRRYAKRMGKDYLIDTSACSKYVQDLLSENAADVMDRAFDRSSVISMLPQIEFLGWVTGGRRLDDDIREFIGESSILEMSEEIIQPTVKLRRHYKKLKLPHAIIAATAIVNDLTLLSIDNSDFDKIQSLNYKSLTA